MHTHLIIKYPLQCYVFLQFMDHGDDLIWPYFNSKSILSDEPIDIYNFGNMKRDFTYIDDLIKSIFLL